MSDILQQMDADDALALVQLVGAACDPQQPLPLLERRRLLASGLAQLVEADVWMSDAGYIHPRDPADSTPVALCDGGWRSAAERMEVLGRCMHSDLVQPIQAHVRPARERGEPVTIHRRIPSFTSPERAKLGTRSDSIILSGRCFRWIDVGTVRLACIAG